MHEVATASRLQFVQFAQDFHMVFVLLLASPVLMFIRQNDDIWLITSDDVCVMSSASADEIDTQFKAVFLTFEILIPFSRYPSSASCVAATACS